MTLIDLAEELTTAMRALRHCRRIVTLELQDQEEPT